MSPILDVEMVREIIDPPAPRLTNVTIADSGNVTVVGLTRDRRLVIGATGTLLKGSSDNGVTWTTYATAPDNIFTVHETDDGELLISGYTPGAPGRFYKTTGWSADRSTMTIGSPTANTGINDNYYGWWSIDSHGPLVVASQYGTKAGAANAGAATNARKIILSRDYGATWAAIYDLAVPDTSLAGFNVATATGYGRAMTALNGDGTIAANRHIHGVCIDPWRSCIWATHGDDDNGVMFLPINRYVSSTATAPTYGIAGPWQIAWQRSGADAHWQQTVVKAMEQAVVLGSDGWPNGVNRIVRNNLDQPMRLEHRLEIEGLGSGYAGGRFLAYQAFRAKWLQDAPLLIPFGEETTANRRPGVLTATVDGEHVYELWRDTTQRSSGAAGGLYSIVGPTYDGYLVGTLNDGRQTNYSTIRGTLSRFPERRKTW
jgi:hypothetical protein